MKEKGKTSQKRSAKSAGPRSVKRAGSVGGARRSGAAGPAAGPAKQTAPAQIEARFRAVFESSRDAIGVSKAGVHVFENPAYRALFGFPPGAVLAGKPVLDLIAPGSRDRIKEYIRRREQRKAAPSTYETRGLHVDGSEFDMEVNVSSYQENGEDHTLVILRDITKRKMAEEEIAERGAMVQQIMDTASVAIFQVDMAGRIIHANKRMAEMFGCAMDELIGSEYVAHVHASERETGRQKMLALLASKIPSVDLERLYWRKDDTEFWGHLAGRRFYDIHGNELGLIGVITDIDKRKRSENALKESEEKYRRFYNETPVLLHSIDRKGIVVDVNDHWLRTIGYERNEVIGRNVTDFFTEASRTYAQEVVLPAFFRDGSVKDIPYQFVKKDGTLVDVLLSAAAERDAAGNIVRSRAVIADITERKQAEDLLRESEEKFRALVETSYDWIWAVDEKGVYTYASPRVKDILGYAAEEVVGKTPIDFMPPKERERVARDFGKIMAKRAPLVALENSNLHKDGRVVILETSGMPILDQEGFFKGYRGIDRDITERKRMEEELKASATRYRMLYEGTPVMMHSIDAEGKLVSVSGQWLKTLGYTRDEVLGRRSTEFLDEQSSTYARTVVLPEFMRTGACTDIPYTFVKKNGERISTLLSAIAERDGTGKVVRSLAVIIDITEKERSEQALRESEERYRQLFDAESDAVFLIDNETGRILMANSAASVLYGYRVEELLEKKNTDLSVEPSETRRVTEETPVMKDNAVIIPLRYHRKKDGTVFPVEITGRFFTYKDRPVHIAAIRDITERKKAEEALRESEERFRAITMTASDAILLMDDKGTIVYWNPAAERIFGYSAGEAVGRELHVFLAPQRLHSEYHKGFARFITTGQGPVINKSVEMIAMKKEGTEFPIEVSTSAMNIDGRWHALGIVRDISDRKRAEHELRESQARLDLALQSAHMGVWRWEIKENRRYFDDLTCQLLGIEKGGFTGTAEEFFRVVHPEDRGRVKALLARTLEQDAPYEPAYRVVWPNGSIRYITARGKLERDETGQPARISGILWDITELRLLEEERLKSQKLESLGTLAGGIAHDFNNLLQGIFGYISMAKLTIDQREKSLAMLEQAEKALHQSVNLTSQLLTFSKGGKPVKKAVDLRPVIENAVKFALSGSRVEYGLLFDAELSMVEADEGQIGQVVQNIVLNAEQAMPLGGRIDIAARNVSAPRAAGLALAATEGLVEIVISDQGTGIPPEHLSRIFDPYFTTKERGSGLGLATSYSIVRNHDGMISVSSEMGKGSTFTVYLPASGAPVEQKAVAPERTAARKGRVLVMDDEQVVRNVAGELLRELGHEVAFADHGDAAIEKYRRAKAEGRPFDVVILDLTIRGGMGGMDTLRKLKEIDPGVRAVVSSGYSDDEIISTYRHHGFRSFLKKPYDMRELGRVLDEVMV